MALPIPGIKSAEAILEPDQLRTARHGRRLRSVGWLGVLFSIATVAVTELVARTQSRVFVIAGVVLTVSLALINWTRLWVRESKEPFQFTFSVAEFEPGPDVESSFGPGHDGNPLAWLRRDLIEKLGERVGRLSLLDDANVPADDPTQDPAAHVHISGWSGLRRGEGDAWYLEVATKVRLGGRGAPERMARTIRFALGDLRPVGDRPARVFDFLRRAEEPEPRPSRLPRDEYERLFERVYWSVASEIYAQIRQGVEAKVALLPPGRLRAAAYLYEADDYAASNALDAYDAARCLYKKALEIYDVRSRPPSATAWRKLVSRVRDRLYLGSGHLHRLLAKLIRHLGRREVLAARAQLGYGRMLVTEWDLKHLAGAMPDELYEAPPNIKLAIERLERLPRDLPERDAILFRAWVTLGIACCDLADFRGAEAALQAAEEIWPAKAHADAEFLLATGLVEGRHIAALRSLSAAVELDSTLVRARFQRASLLEELWRRRETLEPDVADTVDDEYAAVIATDPGNIAAWASRGYIGWLLSGAEPKGKSDDTPTWKRRAISALRAGREYKDVRADTMVAELDWNLARFAAEEGDFAAAYSHHIRAVSGMIAAPTLGFTGYFYKDANGALMARYNHYETQVRDRAVARTGKDGGILDRPIRSVLSFVLNDCGMAHHAHFARCGDPEELERANDLFREAIGLNDDFVLPKYSLALLCREQAMEPLLSPEKRRAYAAEAMLRAEQVRELEPEWVLARFLALEIGMTLADSIDDPHGAARSELLLGPVPEKMLRPLLPHSQLRDGSEVGGRIDGLGTRLDELLRDKEVIWRAEFGEFQVLALSLWTELLLPRSPAGAVALGRRIREVFYAADPRTAGVHGNATADLLEAGPGKEGAKLRVEYWDCWNSIAAWVAHHLKADPIHHSNLSWIAYLPRAAQDAVLAEAMNGPPSPSTAKWIQMRRAELGPPSLEFPEVPSAPSLTPLAIAALRVSRPERVLQIDCGEGDAALYLAREFPRASVRGIDRSERAVRAAAGRVGLDPEGRVAFKVGKPRKLPYPDDNFDLVALVDGRPAIGEIARVLRPTGFLILAYSDRRRAPGRISGRLLRNRLASAGIDQMTPKDAGDGRFIVCRARSVASPAV